MTSVSSILRPVLAAAALVVLATGCGHDHDHADGHGHGHGAAAHDHAHPPVDVPAPMSVHELQHVRLGDEPCRCDRARAVNGWCAHHRVGYVTGVAVPSPALFELIDAHGHDFDPASIRCPTCRDAMTRDGHCATSGIGFVGDRMYLSSLTWALVQGTPATDAPGACGGEVGHVADGWCDACGVGRVGDVTFDRRDPYDTAVAEMPRFERALAVARAGPCDNCAAAEFAGIRCRVCGIDHSGLDSGG